MATATKKVGNMILGKMWRDCRSMALQMLLTYQAWRDEGHVDEVIEGVL